MIDRSMPMSAKSVAITAFVALVVTIAYDQYKTRKS